MPWGVWAVTLFYWISSLILLFLCNYFFMLLFRKPWIDVERIPFPAVTPTYELLREAKAEDGKTSMNFFNPIKNKIFWIPFLLGVIFMFPEVAANYIGIQYLPGIVQDIGFIPIDFSPYLEAVLPGVPWGFAWVWVEACGGAAPLWFFAPFDVQISTLIAYGVFWYIIPLIFISAGLCAPWTDYFSGEGSGIPYGMFTSAWGSGYMWGYTGFNFGLILWLFYNNRKHIVHTLRSAIAGSTREPEEPHSWRFVWTGFIVSMLAWYALVLSSGIEPIIILSLFLWLLNYVSINRVYAETGRPYGFLGMEFSSVMPMTHDAYRLFGYNVTGPNPTLNFDALYFGVARYNSMHVGGHGVTALNVFKIADMTKTDPRSVGWAYIIAIIVGISFHIPLAIWMGYAFGWSEMFRRVGEFGGLTEWAASSINNIGPTTEELTGVPNYHLWLLVSTIVVFVLFWMKSRFAWFFFNPIALGVLMGCGMWTIPGLVVFTVLKWAILRIGGARAYEKYGLPAVLGLWMGVSTISVICRIVWGIIGAAEWMYA